MKKLFLAAGALVMAATAQAGPLVMSTNYGPLSTTPSTITATDTAVAGSVAAQGTVSTSVARFNTDMGILTGVKVRATAASATQKLTVTGSGGTGTANRTASGTGSATLSVTSSASTGASGPVNIGTLSCDTNANNSTPNCPVSSTAGTSVTALLNAPVNSLASYADGANYNVGVVGTARADLTQRTNFTSGSAVYDLTLGAINLAVDYSYYEHAVVQLSDTVLDFGTFTRGSAADLRAFTITNAGGLNAANLALTTILPGGDVDFFAAAFPTLSGLGGGESVTSFWQFNTSMVGAYEAVYTLTFADVLPEGEVGVGLRTYMRTITLRGDVVDVPEPAAIGLLGLGLAFVGLRRRKRA